MYNQHSAQVADGMGIEEDLFLDHRDLGLCSARHN